MTKIERENWFDQLIFQLKKCASSLWFVRESYYPMDSTWSPGSGILLAPCAFLYRDSLLESSYEGSFEGSETSSAKNFNEELHEDPSLKRPSSRVLNQDGLPKQFNLLEQSSVNTVQAYSMNNIHDADLCESRASCLPNIV